MVNKAHVLHMAKVFAHKSLALRESDPIGYDQRAWKHPVGGSHSDWTGNGCNTVACVAGWTTAELEPNNFTDSQSIKDTAARLLGLNLTQMGDLFNGGANPIKESVDSTCAVAAVLKHLAETEEVNWDVGVKAVEEQRRKANEESKEYIPPEE